MPEKIQGTVKWFSNRKGFGFVSPVNGGDDLFLHHSKIVSDAEYKTLRDGFEVQFEINTDDDGKPFADVVTSADGSAVPTSPPRPKKVDNGDSNGGENGEENRTNKRSKGRKGKKTDEEGEATNTPATTTTDENGNVVTTEPKKKGRSRNKRNNTTRGPRLPSWYEELNEDVQKTMDTKGIRTDSGRAFVTIGDARLKIGTGGYIVMVHSTGIVAEGSYTCDSEGTLLVTAWDHVLKHDDTNWTAVPTADIETMTTLVKTISLKDDAVTATNDEETPATLWGADKANPEDLLEPNGFLMKKVAFTASANPGRRGGGPRRRRPTDAPAAPVETSS